MGTIPEVTRGGGKWASKKNVPTAMLELPFYMGYLELQDKF